MTKRRASGDGLIRKVKDKRWEGRIVVGEKSDGTQIFRSVFASTKKEAIEKLHRLQNKYADVKLNEDSQMTLSEWLHKWLAVFAPQTLRQTTIDMYEAIITTYIDDAIGKTKMNKLTRTKLQLFYNGLLENGRIKKSDTKSNGLSPSYVRRIHSMIHRSLEVALKQSIIVSNPSNKISLPRSEDKERTTLTEDEVKTLMNDISTNNPDWYPFFYLVLSTGMRRGEACGLKWSDYNPTSRTLSIRRSIDYKKNQLKETLPKTDDGIRAVVLTPVCAEILKQAQKNSSSDWIFPSSEDKTLPIKPSVADYNLKKAIKSSGVTKVTFHELRHTFITLSLSNGISEQTVATIVGHKDASFTLDRYTHVTDEMQKKAAKTMNNFIKRIVS